MLGNKFGNRCVHENSDSYAYRVTPQSSVQPEALRDINSGMF